MPRRGHIKKKGLKPDPFYNSKLISEFVNAVMQAGKKSVSEKIVYGSMNTIQEKAKEDPLKTYEKAVQNVRPLLETKSRRVGGATYQVPVEVRPNRRTALAIRWIISYAKARSEKTMAQKLAQELIAASKNEGASIKKRDDTHKMAEANKAFAHYRW